MRWDGGSACSVCCDAELLVRLSSMDLHCAARANRAPRVTGETTYAAPADRLGQTWCCGLTPFELPVADRMTEKPGAVQLHRGVVARLCGRRARRPSSSPMTSRRAPRLPSHTAVGLSARLVPDRFATAALAWDAVTASPKAPAEGSS